MTVSSTLPDRIYVERDPETGEKRWFSIAGMGAEYVRASPPEGRQDGGVVVKAPTQEYYLRAMGTNYSAGNLWDHLDKDVVLKAADEIKALRAALTHSTPVEAGSWRSMESAPLDGTVVNVVGRYHHATAGFPRYAAFNDGQWVEYSRYEPEHIVVWAWRPRDEWPREGWDTATAAALAAREATR